LKQKYTKRQIAFRSVISRIRGSRGTPVSLKGGGMQRRNHDPGGEKVSASAGDEVVADHWRS
jgi:hypothetical protein